MKNIVITLFLLVSTSLAESKIKPGSRIVFVGDSITGLSVNARDGFNHQIKWALSQTFKEGEVPELISLGGSGQGVTTWMNIAKMSREKETFLDIKDVDVKTNLDKKTDILIFMLGMNDILCPYVKPTEEDMDRWADDYMKLINNIRERTKPAITGLASITLLTDDPGSQKNIIRNKLNERVKKLTGQHGFIYLETGEEMEKLLKKGRSFDPKFRPTYDFVHPDKLGHTAVSVAVLEGLGATESARALRRKYFETGIFDCSLKSHFSYAVKIDRETPESDKVECIINYVFIPKSGERCKADIVLNMNYPEFNYSSHQNFDTDKETHTGEFKLKFTPSRIKSILNATVTSGEESSSYRIAIPAPWLVAAGIPHQATWSGNNFIAEKATLPCDTELINGEGFCKALHVAGNSFPWQPYYASINYSGFDNPDSLAWYATAYCNQFEAGYATRWIYSEKERKAQIESGHDTFSSTIGLAIWMNGKSLEPVLLLRNNREKQYRDLTLRKGWNHLLIRSDHSTWQWQHTCALRGIDGDNLDDLRYSISPK